MTRSSLLNVGFITTKILTVANSVYNQLLCVPVRAYEVSFLTNKVGHGKLIKAVVTRYRITLATQMIINADVSDKPKKTPDEIKVFC